MKWAAAVIRSSTVRRLRGSIQIVNQAGTVGVANETTHEGRPSTGAVPRRKALVTFVDAPHAGDGTVIGCCGELFHGPPGCRSQRREPMMIDCPTPSTVYSSRFGATAR